MQIVYTGKRLARKADHDVSFDQARPLSRAAFFDPDNQNSLFAGRVSKFSRLVGKPYVLRYDADKASANLAVFDQPASNI